MRPDISVLIPARNEEGRVAETIRALSRARQTAAPLAKVKALELRIDPRLRERGFGLFEGSTYDEAKAVHAVKGGVLLPYRRHYFVTSTALLDRLGFEAGHADWAAIGYDFARPASAAAPPSPKIRGLFEATYFAGLRKAGVPEQ